MRGNLHRRSATIKTRRLPILPVDARVSLNTAWPETKIASTLQQGAQGRLRASNRVGAQLQDERTLP